MKQKRQKRNRRKRILPIIFLLLVLGLTIYLLSEKIPKQDVQPTPQSEEEDIPEEEPEEEIPQGPLFQELYPIIDEQQGYVVIPTKIDSSNPPTLIIYSHGSNTTVTQNMEDQFMKDLQQYGILFTSHNYIFAASNQHGVNWGSKSAIQDTINIKNWVEENYSIQPKVFLIGFSMGGLPTMNFATTYPEIIQKIALLAPTVKSSEWNQTRAEKLSDMDIKLWHGNDDVNVPYSYSVFFVKKLSGYGITIEFVTLEGKTHFDIDTEYSQEILEFFNS